MEIFKKIPKFLNFSLWVNFTGLDDSSAWQAQQNWPKTGNAIRCLKSEIEFNVMKEMYAALGMLTGSEKIF